MKTSLIRLFTLSLLLFFCITCSAEPTAEEKNQESVLFQKAIKKSMELVNKKTKKVNEILKKLEVSSLDYIKKNNKWPDDLNELLKYIKEISEKIDLACFDEIFIKQNSEFNRLEFNYHYSEKTLPYHVDMEYKNGGNSHFSSSEGLVKSGGSHFVYMPKE